MKNKLIHIYLLFLIVIASRLDAQTIPGCINAISNTDTVTYSGATAQTIPANLFVSNTLSNLKINNIAGVSIGGILNISNALFPIAGTLITGGYLTLLSTSSATVRIDQVTGMISGNVTVQRYIPAKTARKYSLIGSPISQSIRNSWQQLIYITGVGTGGSACGSTLGNGVISTDKYNTNGFDVTQTNIPSMFTYSASPVNDSRWVSIPNTFSSIVSGTGYKVNIRGNRNSVDVNCNNQLETATPSAPEEVTLSATGTVNTGDIAITLNNPSVHPYTLLANPYPSPISYTFLQGSNSNLYNKMWTFSPLGNGNYTTYSSGVIANGATGYDNVSGDYIASGQAFFVQANAAGNVTFHESHKISKTMPNTQYFGTTIIPLIRVGLKDTSNNLLDEVVVRFNSNGSQNLNKDWDAASFGGGTNTLAVLKSNNSLAIATFSDKNINDTIPLVVTSSNTGIFNLSFTDFGGIDSSLSLYLKDNFLSTTQDVRAMPSYVFSVTADTNSKGNNRFELVAKKNATLLSINSIMAKVTANGNSAFINWTVTDSKLGGYEIERSNDGIAFYTIGKTSMTNFVDSTPQVATNYYRIKVVNTDGTILYSNVVAITISGLPLITIFPNPMKGKIFHVSMGNVAAGKYAVNIYNVLGQKVGEQIVSCLGGNGNYPIILNSALAVGTYSVIVREEASNQLFYQTKLSVVQQ